MKKVEAYSLRLWNYIDFSMDELILIVFLGGLFCGFFIFLLFL